MDGVETRSLLRALAGEQLDPPPWWLMRQACRLLPEYREVRAKASDFVSLYLTPELAVEVTLQPIHRFGMDAAILFSDILLIPYVLGQRLDFPSDRPALDPIENVGEVDALAPNRLVSRLEPVFETVGRCRAALPEATTLIGFAGAPWTVATYMVEDGSTRDFQRVKAWSYGDPAGFAALMDVVTEATIAFLSAQIEAGPMSCSCSTPARALSPRAALSAGSFEPTRRIRAALKLRFPTCLR